MQGSEHEHDEGGGQRRATGETQQVHVSVFLRVHRIRRTPASYAASPAPLWHGGATDATGPCTPAIEAAGRSASATTPRRRSSATLRLVIFKHPLPFQADPRSRPPAASRRCLPHPQHGIDRTFTPRWHRGLRTCASQREVVWTCAHCVPADGVVLQGFPRLHWESGHPPSAT